jgi:RES domain-containing protein
MAGDRPPTFPATDAWTAFRSTDYDTPFWATANTYPARWSKPEDGATQYLALDPRACWAEVARHEEITNDAELAMLRRPLWAIEVRDLTIADYSTFDRADAAGFPADALVEEDWTRCQVEGTRLRKLGYRGVASPSAALPGSINLTLFGPRLPSAWGQQNRLASFVPCVVVSVGAPSPDLAQRVRFRGQPHGLLDRYHQWLTERGNASAGSGDLDGGSESSDA